MKMNEELKQMSIYVTEEERELFKRAMKKKRIRSMSAYIVGAAVVAAESVCKNSLLVGVSAKSE